MMYLIPVIIIIMLMSTLSASAVTSSTTAGLASSQQQQQQQQQQQSFVTPRATTRRPIGHDPYLQPKKPAKHSLSSSQYNILAQLQGQVTEAVDKIDQKISQVQ